MKVRSWWVVITIAGIFLAGAVITGAAIFWRTQSAKYSLEASRMERAKIEERIAEVKRIRNFLEQSKEKITSAEQFFISESEIVPFLEALESSARQSHVGLVVASASLGAAGTAPAFSLKATGEFQDLFRYLLLLENFPHLVAVEKVNFAKTSPWDMQIIIRLLAYESGR